MINPDIIQEALKGALNTEFYVQSINVEQSYSDLGDFKCYFDVSVLGSNPSFNSQFFDHNLSQILKCQVKTLQTNVESYYTNQNNSTYFEGINVFIPGSMHTQLKIETTVFTHSPINGNDFDLILNTNANPKPDQMIMSPELLKQYQTFLEENQKTMLASFQVPSENFVPPVTVAIEPKDPVIEFKTQMYKRVIKCPS